SAALAGGRPEHRQRQLQRGDAAPRRGKVTAGQLLQVGRRGRVVGGREVNEATLQRLPQLLIVGPLADRALELRLAIGDVFGVEEEVVLAGFHRQRQT
nr:hypothetical protein [Tanacetum cinerariifolium]